MSQAPAEERRLQRQTDMATQRDAEAAQIESAGNPSDVGEWGPSADWPVVGIHVALMPNGTVLAYDSNGDYPNDDQSYTRATIWDPKTDRHTAVNPNTGINIFCSGLAHLMDGRLYVAGGNESTATGDGIKATHVFDGETKTWEREGDMATERWYPSVTPLRDGEMLITEGDDLDHPHIPEVRETDGNIRELTALSDCCRSTRGSTLPPTVGRSSPGPTGSCAASTPPAPGRGAASRSTTPSATASTAATAVTPSTTSARSWSPAAATKSTPATAGRTPRVTARSSST